MTISIKKVMGVERNSIRKLNKLQLSEELFSNPLFSDANLIAYYRFEGNANDEKTNYNGSASNVTFGTSYGKFGQGGLFNNSSSIITSSITSNLNGDYSFCGWIKPSTNPDGEDIVCASHVNSYSNYYIILSYTNVSGTYYIRTGKYDGTHNPLINYTVTLPTSSWTFICGTKSGSTLYLYLNGSLVNSGTDTTTSTPSYSSFCIGGEPSQPRYFNGSIDDISVFSRALTSTEITSLYNSQIKKFMGVSNL